MAGPKYRASASEGASGLPLVQEHVRADRSRAGAQLEWVQAQLGHSSITLTRDVYGHWSRKAEKVAAERLDGALRSRTRGTMACGAAQLRERRTSRAVAAPRSLHFGGITANPYSTNRPFSGLSCSYRNVRNKHYRPTYVPSGARWSRRSDRRRGLVCAGVGASAPYLHPSRQPDSSQRRSPEIEDSIVRHQPDDVATEDGPRARSPV